MLGGSSWKDTNESRYSSVVLKNRMQEKSGLYLKVLRHPGAKECHKNHTTLQILCKRFVGESGEGRSMTLKMAASE